ncbi:MAG TPA: chromate transporter [Symbiobacteriaceae bacterium]|nr:chromate transporter [Symbiobacteriaceae bacterium]
MRKPYGQLFLLGLWLGTTVFGGATQAYGVIRQAVTERAWLTGEEVDGIYSLATFLPGPSFLNMWGAAAARVAGFPGAVLAQVGLMLPSFLLVCGLPLLARIPFLGARAGGALNGATWATVGLLLAAGVDGLRDRRGWVKMALFCVLLWLGVHPLLLMAVAVAAGAAVPTPVSAKGEA